MRCFARLEFSTLRLVVVIAYLHDMTLQARPTVSIARRFEIFELFSHEDNT